ncbi:hypothetical protein D3C84_697350 [compost metagenome]
MLIGIALVLKLGPQLLVRQAIGRSLEAVVFQLHIARAHRLPVVELAHVGALLQRAVAEVEEQLRAGGQGRRVVGKDDAVLALLELVEVEQSLFGGQPVDEREVRLPVLHAVLPLGVFVFQREGVVGDAVLLQQDAEDFVGLLGLEHAGVLAQGESPQRRLHHELIAGAAKAAVPLRQVAHHPAYPPLQLAVVPHQQLAGLVQHGAKVDVRLGAGQLQSQLEGTVQRLLQHELGHHEGGLGQRPHLDGKL